MEYKELFEKALTEVSDRCTFSTDHEMAEKIAERAKNMKKEFTVQNNTHPSLIEADPVYQEPKKGTKIFHAVAGIAGAAAVLTGCFFGLRYLNEHGGLKEGGSDELRAGYSQNAATTTAAEQPEFTTIFHSYSITDDSGYVKVDQRYDAGNDITVHLKGYTFDGTWAKIYYDIIFKEDVMGEDGAKINHIAPKETETGHTECVEYAFNANYAYCTANYRLDTPADSVDVTFVYEDMTQSELFGLTMHKSTENINEPIVSTAVYMTTPHDDVPVMTEEAEATAEYEAKLKDLNNTKEYYEQELEVYETAKQQTALLLADLNTEKELLTQELTKLRSLGEDTDAVEKDIRIAEEKIGQQETMLDIYSDQAEQTYDKLGVVKMQIAKTEAEMKGHIFYEFGDDEAAVTEETTVTTDVLVTSEYAPTDAADMQDDTTYHIPQVQITDGMIDHTDVTLALGEGNVKILPGRIYDGRILKLKLTGDIDDDTHIGIRSVKNPRNIIQGGHKNDDGTYTLSALIPVPDGETDILELIDLGAVKTEGKPKAIEVINVSGIKDYEPLTERVGVDMTQFGIPDEALEWIWLSPFGLEMYFTSDKSWKSPNISVEWTTLNGTVCKSRGHSGTGNFDESTGKYHENLLIVPDEDTDLTEMKEFSINGLKIKRAEFMPRSFWDIPESGNEMTPVETFVQIAAPEE